MKEKAESDEVGAIRVWQYTVEYSGANGSIWKIAVLMAVNTATPSRDGGTGPADPASAGPIILV